MGQTTLVVVTLTKDSNLPADAVQNTFTFGTPGGATSTEIADIKTALTAFYNTATTSGPTLASFLSQSINQNTDACQMEFYNLDGHQDGTPHGSPISTTTWTITTTGTASLPSEIAAALTFHSNYGSDVEFAGDGSRPRARDRGRVYIGPLSTTAVGTDGTTHEVYLVSGFITALCQTAARLRDDAATVWSQWSRAAAEVNPVTAGWVDDAPDIQRRRGTKARARTTW